MSTAGETGEWSRDVGYERATRRAALEGDYVFTPHEPSGGNYVTVEFTTTFPATPGEAGLDAGAQAAVRLAANGSFQVWTKKGWLDVAAQGVEAVADAEYSISTVFDYDAGRYSVSVKDARGAWRRFEAAGGAQAFPMAAKAERISSVSFDGKTRFLSLKGQWTTERHLSAYDESAGSRRDFCLVTTTSPGAGGHFVGLRRVRRETERTSSPDDGPAGSQRTLCHPTTGPPGARENFVA